MGWIRVEGKPREVQGYQDGKTIAVLDLQVATAADLPSLGGVVEGYVHGGYAYYSYRCAPACAIC